MDLDTRQQNSENSESLYVPLRRQVGSHRFRLIALSPVVISKSIQCSLYETTLRSSYCKYEALSYRWGDPDDRPRTVIVNGITISVTKNLYSALFNMRDPVELRVLWVDALCINQDDLEERSYQVSLMPEIYMNASRVLSWLGVENAHTLLLTRKFLCQLRFRSIKIDPELSSLLEKECSASHVRQLLAKHYVTTPDDEHNIKLLTSEKFRKSRELKLQNQTAFPVNTEDLLDEGRRIHRICLPVENIVLKASAARFEDRFDKRFLSPDTSESEEKTQLAEKPSWVCLGKICSLEYWRRLWIVQEIILAKDIVLQSGDVTLHWQTFSDFFLCLKYTTGDESRRPGTQALKLLQTQAAELVSLRREHAAALASLGNGGLGFSRIVRSCWRTDCHDPRDKVYALLGLVKQTNLMPDYSKSTTEIYEQIIGQSNLWRNDLLCSFSAMMQEHFGGLPLSPIPANTSNHIPRGPLLRTRAKVDGSIIILGEAFTSIQDAKDLIANWQELYFHRVLSHEPASNLSVTVRDALETMGHDFRRVFRIESKRSHVRLISRENEVPDYNWDPIQRRYTKNFTSNDGKVCSLCEDDNLSSPAVFDMAALSTDLLHSTSDTFRPMISGESPPTDSGIRDPNVANDQSPTLPKKPYQDPVHEHAPPLWIIGTRGQIGLVPASAKEGDKICHFQGTDVVAIVRSDPPDSAEYYSLVGSGLMLRRWGEVEKPIYEGSAKTFRYSVGDRGRLFGLRDEMSDIVEFHLDIETLRLLTHKPGNRE